jgi:hypothetical protein
MSYISHTFNVGHAVRFGIHEAIIMANLAFWIRKNKANKKSFKDGRYWTYNSAKAFSELFPYLSVHQVRRALDKLESEGVIIKANHNQSSYDRTTWFAFTDEWDAVLCEDHFAPMPNGVRKDAKTLISTDINTNLLFDAFWKAYPKKVGKDAASKAFAKRKPDDKLLKEILQAVELQKVSDQWTKDGGQYIPNPATWLNQGRWMDELENKPDNPFAGAI